MKHTHTHTRITITRTLDGDAPMFVVCVCNTYRVGCKHTHSLTLIGIQFHYVYSLDSQPKERGERDKCNKVINNVLTDMRHTQKGTDNAQQP